MEGLGHSSFDLEEFRRSESNTSKKYFDKTHKAMLETTPSFSIYNLTQGVEGEEGSQQEEIEGEVFVLERTITIEESIRGTTSREFSFGRKTMGLIEEEEEEEDVNGFQKLGVEDGVEPVSPLMYLATGLGMDGAGFGGRRVDFAAADFDESGDVEEYYRRMVNEDPCNPLFLRNYAQLLQSKGDLQRAEEYYSRATLADPQDGEILMQYAKLIWDVHRDQARALSYFERAAKVASDDSHVLAANASFLWDIEDEGEDDTAEQGLVEEGLSEFHNLDQEDENKSASPSLHPAAGLGIDVAACGSVGCVDFSSINASEISKVEEHYKKMVEENPCNPLFLRNYAQFLFQTKGELQQAEEYYSRAILADPGDGEIMSQYAKLAWELHHDRDKALSYFKQAVQATPGDSHVLAAYARFLWETDEEEEENNASMQDHIQVSLFHEAATSANA